VHVAFDGLAGSVLCAAATPLAAGPVTLDAPALPSAVGPSELAQRVDALARRRAGLVQAAARGRLTAELERLGVPPGAEEVRAEGARSLLAPVVVGLVRAREGRRLAVLDAVTGRVDEPLSDALTPRLADVLPALGDGG
jgi:hypothetical protein